MLFTFPSRYLCAIGLSVVFSLTGWSPQIPAEFLVLRGTQVPPDAQLSISRTGLSPSVARLSCLFRYGSCHALPAVLQPRALPQDNPGLGFCAFARHYLRNRFYFLFLWVLRCFSSPRSLRDFVAVTASPPPGFPIRTSAGHRAFAPHRGFSQLVTSFFASGSQRHPPCALGSLSCSRTWRAQLKRALDLALYLLQTCVTPKDHAADQSVCSYQFFARFALKLLQSSFRVPSMSMTVSRVSFS